MAWENAMIKVCDIGLNRVRTCQTAMISALNGCEAGTPLYMAPEVFLSGKGTSTSSDA